MLTLLWEASPIETIVLAVIVLFCGAVLGLCLIGLFSGDEEEDDVC